MKKDEDIVLKDAIINLLFKKKLSIEEILLYHSFDKSLLPDILFQNYLHIITKYDKNNHNIFKNLDILENITESYSIAENIEYFIKKEHTWDLFEHHGMLTCYSLYINMPKYPRNVDYNFYIQNNIVFYHRRSYKTIFLK